jgi:ribosome-associated heat shock protein Hsp15
LKHRFGRKPKLTQDKVRLDKWLWAARFFKTRSLAVQAIAAGHVNVNGERAKPSRSLKAAETLEIRTEHGRFVVQVLALSEQRRAAELARTLYEETAESIAQREREQFMRAMQPQFDHAHIKGRPTKKMRRELNQLYQQE